MTRPSGSRSSWCARRSPAIPMKHGAASGSGKAFGKSSSNYFQGAPGFMLIHEKALQIQSEAFSMHLSAAEQERRARQRAAALSERDAARYIGMSESWLRHGRLYQSDTVPPHLRIGRSV